MPVRRDLLALVLLVLGFCALYEGGLGGSDGWGYFANVESLLEDGDLDLADNLSPRGREGAAGETGTADGRLGGVPHPTRPGRVVNSYPLGKAAADAPFYLLGKAAGVALGDLRFPAMAGTPYEGIPPRRMLCILGVVLGSNLYAAAAAALTFLGLLRCGFPRPVAWTSVLLAFLAGPLPYYAVNGMSHAPATALSAGILLFWVSLPRGVPDPVAPRRAWLLGLMAGAAFSLRYAGAGLVAALAALLAGGGWLASARRLLAFALGVACVASTELVRNWVELGHPLRTLYPPLLESLVWKVPGLPWVDYVPVLNLLAASRHGLLRWSPLAGLGLLGLALVPRDGQGLPARRVAWALLLGQCILPAIGGSYHAGSGFSQRYLCEAMPCLALGLALLLARWPRRALAAAGFAALAAWNLLLFALTRAHLPRRALETGTREGWMLSDYLGALDVPAGEAASRVLGATVPGQLAGPWAGAAGLLVLAAAAVALIRWARREWGA